MYVYTIYFEQNNSNNRKIGRQYLIISFYLKDMSMFNKLVIENDPAEKNNAILCFYGRG